MQQKSAKLLAYLATATTSLFYSGGMVTAQLIGTALPRFQLNLIRFGSQFLLCLMLALLMHVKVLWIRNNTDIVILFGSSCAYTWCVFALNLGPIYAPVGNLEAICITVFIVLNVWVAVLRCKASWAILIAAVMSCVGVVFLTQPDFLFGGVSHGVFEKELCPCFGIQKQEGLPRPDQCKLPGLTEVNLYYYTNSTDHVGMPGDALIQNTNDSRNAFVRSMNYSENAHMHNMDSSDDMSSYKVPDFSNESTHYTESVWVLPGMTSETFGYLIAFSAGITFFIMVQVNEKFLLPHYHYVHVTFWYGVIGCALSGVLMLGVEKPSLAPGLVCGGITAAHSLFLSCTQILINVSLQYITAEENSILQTLGIVILFIAQSTILKQFQPTNGNMYEYIGAILIIVACVLEPICVLTRKEKRKDVIAEDKVDEKSVTMVLKEEDCNEKTRLLIERYPSMNSGKYSGV